MRSVLISRMLKKFDNRLGLLAPMLTRTYVVVHCNFAVILVGFVSSREIQCTL